ncbi:hypothetical protein K1719_019537 [Acacia pycnantha]|nr:hypothetical protein K1719_019537 [Acacia pycnantha]
MWITLYTEETNSEPRRSTTAKEEVEWVPLEKHPVFVAVNNSIDDNSNVAFSRNLVAWDGSSRLYFWEPNSNCLHYLSLRLGEPEPTSILVASPSKPVDAGRSKSSSSMCPAVFLFGGDHLWDRFSVFILFGDGAICSGWTSFAYLFHLEVSQIRIGARNIQ